ncbi:MAG TPA: DNA primase [Phycisphaerae bacterium]|nr:DNA primase [Phycisphaerae bacterium]
MAGSHEIFEQVRGAVDIVEVIGESIALKRAGKEFKGLCPFHDDRRPSMAVVPQKQIFHCFVCGTGGDVFKFVREYHKLSAGEALRMLAQRAGIKLPELPRGRGGAPQEGPSVREQIASTNEWACDFFQKHLQSPQGGGGKAGLDYFHSRGLTDETIAKFRLGFAPDSWTGLVNAAMRLAIKPEHLEQAGLIKKRQDGSPYDVFRNRVIFPIIDASGGSSGNGRVVAFGGRILQERRDEAGNVVEAKYLNSPETRLFNKSESMYGLNLARQQIIRTRTAVVVEGYMDVIACHQVGVTNVIATLGTALTPEHARALKNYAQTIVLVFDSDDAGFRAADRAMEVFVRGTLDVKIASVPDGKDPCDFCMKNGGEPFQKLVDNAVDAMTYQWNRLGKQFHGTQSLTAKQEAITQFMRFVGTAMESSGGSQNMDPIRRGLLLSKLAGLVGMSIEEVTATLKRLGHQGAGPRAAEPAHAQGLQSPPVGSGGGGENWPSMQEPAAKNAPAARPAIGQLKGLDAAEGWLLGALLAQPPLYEKLRDELSLTLFVTFQDLAAHLLEYFESHTDLTACSFAQLISDLENPELVREAIELEQKTSDWLDPSNLSPNQIKLLKQSVDDRGLTLGGVAQDSLAELRNARRHEDPSIAADLGDEAGVEGGEAGPAVDPDFASIMEAAKRNAQGGNRRYPGV